MPAWLPRPATERLRKTQASTDIEWSPLQYAAHDILDDVAIFKVLINAGADPNHVSSLGGTALMTATSFNSDGVVRLLLEAGANESINYQDFRGYTALIRASVTWNTDAEEIMQVLLDYNSDVSIRDDDGWTAWDHINARSEFVVDLEGSDVYWALKP
jgi:ankyrin repeat protein